MSPPDAAKATPIVRQQSQTELEMQAGRRAAELRTAQLAVPVAPKKTIGAVNVIPLSLNATPRAGNEPVDIGITHAFAVLANAPGVVPEAAVPAQNALAGSTPAEQQTEQQPGPNAGQTKQSSTSPLLGFLDDFFGSDKRHLVAIKKHEKKIEAHHFEATDLAGQQKFITNHSDAGFDIYFSPNPIKGTLHKKAKKSDVAEARHLWIDLDPRVNEPLEAERAAMLAQLTTNLPKGIPRPNRIIDSGRGYWGYWKLDKPAPVDGKGPLTDIVESYGKGIEQAFGDRFADGCRNIDRVARLAGTTNRKTGNVARVLHEFSHDEPHAIESFPRSVTNPKDQEAPKGETFKLSGTYEPIEPDDPALDKLDKKWKDLIATDDYGAGYKSNRSGAERAVACACASAGIDKQAVARLVMDGRRKFGAHTREHKNLGKLIDGAYDYVLAKSDETNFRDFTDKGKRRPSLANAVIAINTLGIEARQDLFHHRIIVKHKGDAPTIREGVFTDDTIGAIRSLINNTYQLDCGDAHTLAAVKEIARDNSFDPVLDYLTECQGKWDGKKRIDTWVIDYMGVEDTPLHHAIGRLMLIASVRRARVPGCKFDQICVLESEEGFNKSTAIRVLAGDENFSDQSVLNVGEREAQEQIEGIWLHESADLTGLRKAEVERVKAFASRQFDRARPAYGKVREDRPRRCTQWASTNDDAYLASQTGNRRFWSLPVGRIDIDALRRDRDQLWGEAATLEAAGASIVLDPKLWPAEHEEQEKRRIVDPWEAVIENMPASVMVGEPLHQQVQIIHQDISQKKEMISSADVLVYVCKVPTGQQHAEHGKRLARVMKRCGGWKTPKSGRVSILGSSVAAIGDLSRFLLTRRNSRSAPYRQRVSKV
jgi:predicted P-loop ATPase